MLPRCWLATFWTTQQLPALLPHRPTSLTHHADRMPSGCQLPNSSSLAEASVVLSHRPAEAQDPTLRCPATLRWPCHLVILGCVIYSSPITCWALAPGPGSSCSLLPRNMVLRVLLRSPGDPQSLPGISRFSLLLPPRCKRPGLLHTQHPRRPIRANDVASPTAEHAVFLCMGHRQRCTKTQKGLFIHCFVLEKEDVFHKLMYVLFMFLYSEFVVSLYNESVTVISLLSFPFHFILILRITEGFLRS